MGVSIIETVSLCPGKTWPSLILLSALSHDNGPLAGEALTGLIGPMLGFGTVFVLGSSLFKVSLVCHLVVQSCFNSVCSRGSCSRSNENAVVEYLQIAMQCSKNYWRHMGNGVTRDNDATLCVHKQDCA